MNIGVQLTRYEIGLDVDFIVYVLMPVRDDLIHFIWHQVTEFQPRDNYCELLRLLLLLFL